MNVVQKHLDYNETTKQWVHKEVYADWEPKQLELHDSYNTTYEIEINEKHLLP